MSRTCDFALSCLIVAWTFAASAQSAEPKTPSSRPEAAVESLYRQVVRRAPSGLLEGADKEIFAPYLSSALRRKMDVAAACYSDWLRQNKGQPVKAPFAWSEFGLFSGGNERTSPASFHIENIHKTNAGPFRIAVSMSYRPVDGSGSIREDGRFVVDEVIFPKEEAESEYTLSGILSEGCKGPHWVDLR